MLGGLLLYGADLHYGGHSVHIHDRSIGEESPRDVNIKVYHEYLTIITFNSINDDFVSDPYLYTCIYPEYCSNFFDFSSRITNYPDKREFWIRNLYLLNSAYLV